MRAGMQAPKAPNQKPSGRLHHHVGEEAVPKERVVFPFPVPVPSFTLLLLPAVGSGAAERRRWIKKYFKMAIEK